jgi:predicted Zn-dependent protease
LTQLDLIEGKYDAAHGRLKAMLADHGDNSMVRLWLGDVEAVKGNPSAALDNYRSVVERDPQNARALNNLAFVLTAYSKKPDEALGSTSGST